MLIARRRTTLLATAAVIGLGVSAGACMRPDPKSSPPLRKPSDREVLAMRYAMAEALVQREQYGQAAPYVRDLLALHPKDARLHYLLGVILREQGVEGAAERELHKSVQLQPKAPAAYAALAVLRTKQRKLHAAEKLLRRAVELSPRSTRYHSDLGFCLLLQRRLPDALQSLEEAVRLDPSNRRAFNNLGLVLGLQGKRDAAMKAFRQAGSLVMALTNMGFVAQMRGRPLQARRYYERALQKRADFAPALRNLRSLDPNAAAAYAPQAADPEPKPKSKPKSKKESK